MLCNSEKTHFVPRVFSALSFKAWQLLVPGSLLCFSFRVARTPIIFVSNLGHFNRLSLTLGLTKSFVVVVVAVVAVDYTSNNFCILIG